MPRPTTPLLSPDIIADAAMELVESGSGFGVNAIARRLGVTPSSLYNHVSGRDEIVELMRSRLTDRYPLRVAGRPWDEIVAQVLRDQRRMYSEHPVLVPLIIDKAITDESVLGWYDGLAQVLRDAGFPGREVMSIITLLDAFAIGFGLDLAGPAEAWVATDDTPSLAASLAEGPPGRGRSEDAFEAALAMIVDGLRARLAASR